MKERIINLLRRAVKCPRCGQVVGLGDGIRMVQKNNLKAWQLSHQYEIGCPECALKLKIKNKGPAILLFAAGLLLTWFAYDWLFDKNTLVRDGIASLAVLATLLFSLLLLRIEFAENNNMSDKIKIAANCRKTRRIY